MSLSTLSIWVRDTAHPCLPYQSTGHSWTAIILTCDLQPLSFGAVNNGIFRLTEPGAGGGKVHGQVGVPPGCYIVFAVATCKNIFTDMALVQVGCDKTSCVNLIPKRVSTCAGQLLVTLGIAQILGPKFSSGCPAGNEIPKEVVARAKGALEELLKYLPWDPVMSALPISVDELEAMAKEEKSGRRKD